MVGLYLMYVVDMMRGMSLKKNPPKRGQDNLPEAILVIETYQISWRKLIHKIL